MFQSSSTLLTNRFGDFRISVWSNSETGKEHVVLVRDDVRGRRSVLVRIGSECLTGMVLDSADCDCRPQQEYALQLIADHPPGVLILLRQEGRGHGLITKVRAMERKRMGADTFEAVEQLGLPSDVRDYADASRMLQELGVRSIRLITNNPAKWQQLTRDGVAIDSIVATPMFTTAHNLRHLQAKKNSGHSFSGERHAVVAADQGTT